jgi:hypothetical protein
MERLMAIAAKYDIEFPEAASRPLRVLAWRTGTSRPFVLLPLFTGVRRRGFSEVRKCLEPVEPYVRGVSVLRETSIALVRAR